MVRVVLVLRDTRVRIDRTEWKEVESSEYAFRFAESSRVRRISIRLYFDTSSVPVDTLSAPYFDTPIHIDRSLYLAALFSRYAVLP